MASDFSIIVVATWRELGESLLAFIGLNILWFADCQSPNIPAHGHAMPDGDEAPERVKNIIKRWLDAGYRFEEPGGRLENGWKQTLFADEIGASQGMVSKWVRGNGLPGRSNELRIVRVCFGAAYESNPEHSREVSLFKSALSRERGEYAERKLSDNTPRTSAQVAAMTNRGSWTTEHVGNEKAAEIFEIVLFRPMQGDDKINDFPLAPYLSAGTREGAHKGLRWEMGLSRFKILTRLTGCQISRHMTIAANGISREGSAWVVTADARDEFLRGPLLEDDAVLSRVSIAKDAWSLEITMQAQCEDTDLLVKFIQPESPEKEIALTRAQRQLAARLIQSFERTADGDKVTLGAAHLSWASEDQ